MITDDIQTLTLQECRETALFSLNQTAQHYVNQGDFKTAINWMQHMTALGPEKGMAWSGLAFLLNQTGKPVDALIASNKAIDTGDELPEIYYNHGAILNSLGRLHEAIEAYRKAIELRPDDAIVHFNLGSALIHLRQYEEGLKEFEWRLKSHANLVSFMKRYDKPIWEGQENCTIAVVNEQGLGDAIMFCRYIPDLRKKGCRIILEVQDSLVPLMSSLDVDFVCGRSDDLTEVKPLPEHDYVICFSSLPTIVDPALNNVPFSEGYLKPNNPKDLVKVEYFNLELFAHLKKVGICWCGSPWHPLDKERSTYLRNFAPLQKVKGLAPFFNLQKGETKRSWGDTMEGSKGMHLVDCSEFMGDFNQTANLIKHLDLVITIDSAVAHLAAAMGKPVWMLIAQNHDWRWDNYTTTTRWYKSMRIFQVINSWEELLEDVADKLRIWVDDFNKPKIFKV